MVSKSGQARVGAKGAADPSLSLYQLLKPEVLADPYSLYRHLRETDPVHWDPFLHAWVVTRYADAVTVFELATLKTRPAKTSGMCIRLCPRSWGWPAKPVSKIWSYTMFRHVIPTRK